MSTDTWHARFPDTSAQSAADWLAGALVGFSWALRSSMGSGAGLVSGAVVGLPALTSLGRALPSARALAESEVAA
jgi:hypothetical protein